MLERVNSKLEDTLSATLDNEMLKNTAENGQQETDVERRDSLKLDEDLKNKSPNEIDKKFENKDET